MESSIITMYVLLSYHILQTRVILKGVWADQDNLLICESRARCVVELKDVDRAAASNDESVLEDCSAP